jgi:hypothetical protein
VSGGEGNNGIAMRNGEDARQNQHAAAPFARQRGHHGIDFGITVSACGPHRYSERRRRFLHSAKH